MPCPMWPGSTNACDDRIMLSFEASARGRGEYRRGGWRVVGFRVAAPHVLVLEDGSLWVTDQEGVRHTLDAPTVVIWDTGEWVSYGSEGPAKFKDYWHPRVSETGFHPCGPPEAPPGLPPQWADQPELTTTEPGSSGQ